MLTTLRELSKFIGNTPLKPLSNPYAALYAKLEYNNFSGSSKDRAAYSIIYNGIKDGKIKPDTTIIASSSGNLAIACASICKYLGLKFIPVIDPNINKDYETLLNMLAYKVVKVTVRDKTGGYLLTRIDLVNEMCANIKNSFCADQYGDPNNFRGYYGLSRELLQSLGNVDNVFIAVSSSGAITGISRSLKEKKPDVRIIGVDVEGSVIFGHEPKKRYISGIGASKIPPIIENALIDEVVLVSQPDIVRGCLELLNDQVIFGGASSGAVYYAARTWLQHHKPENHPITVLIFPDRGTAYLDSVYNPEWASELERKTSELSSVK